MPVTGNWQIEVNTVLMRADDTVGDYGIVTWPDLFRRAPKAADLELMGDGVSFGVTRNDAVEHSWDVEIIHATPATLQARLITLRNAWSPDDAQLHFQIGDTHYMLEGQPRMFRVDDRNRQFGQLLVAVSFLANPTITVVP